ncbi:MAG: CapA family protein [Victivallaceae bacterium]|nr:CapA family protein [Victivallaceae bacterium]
MKNRITLAAVGDMSFARKTETMLKNNGPVFPFTEIAPKLQSADIRFGNLESVLIPEDFPLEKASGHPLQSCDFATESLRLLDFHVLHMASNHVLDCGWRGLLHTYDCIRGLGAQPLGAGYNQSDARTLRIVEAKGTKVGFLGYLQAGDWTLEGGGGRVAYLKLADVESDIRRYRDQVDVMVISIHGDIEFQPAPSIPRRDLCRRIAEAGADLILCHHPHVPQGIERWKDCLIHYSLGNFLFDTDGYQINNSPEVTKSHIFFVNIEDGKISDWHRHYLRLDPNEGGRPQSIPENQYYKEDAYYKELDAILLDTKRLREAWHKNCLDRLSLLMQRFEKDAQLDPKIFLHKYGVQLFSDMAHEYLDGLYDIARDDYKKHAHADFEYSRPFAAYE